MSLVESATGHEIQQLLERFPVSALRAHWSDVKARTKEEVCKSIAQHRDPQTIIDFLQANVDCCKQHVYIFRHKIPRKNVPSVNLGTGSRIWENGAKRETAFLLRVSFSVSVNNPVAEETLTFLWPVTLSWMDHHAIVRFVTLEPNVKTYFPTRAPILRERDLDEDAVLILINKETGDSLSTEDIHKGIKKLWEDDFVEGKGVQYKKFASTASELMDPEKGIKQCYPKLYAALQTETWNHALFTVIAKKKNLSVSTFVVYPTDGRIGFPRFSKVQGDTEHVVREILRHN